MTAISNTSVSRRFMRLALAERAAMIRLDDSNGAFGSNSTGWNEFMSKHMNQTAGLPLWSTDLFTQGEGGIGNPYGSIGLGWNVGNVSLGTAWTGAGAVLTSGIAAIDDHLDMRDPARTSGTPNGAAYIGSGSPIINQQALTILEAHPIVQLALDWHFQYGKFATGGNASAFVATARHAGTPNFTEFATPLTVSSTGGDSVQWTSLPIAADATARNVNFKWRINGIAMNAKLWLGWHHAVAPSITTGLLHTNLISVGTWSLHDYLETLTLTPDLTLSDYLGHIRSLSGPNNTVCIVIQSGMNDRNDSALTSLGPNPTTPGDSPAAFADNLQGIINRFTAVYTAQGWARNQLYFMIQTAHPQSTSALDAKVGTYRVAANDVASSNENAFHFDVSQVVSNSEMTANGWFAASDHLTDPGYENISTRIASALANLSAPSRKRNRSRNR